MLADFFTKPLNGSLFRKFRDVILGYKPVSSLRETMPSDIEERVGNCEQQSQNRHNVPQDNTSKIINVPTCVPIVPQEEQYKENQQQQEGFIKSNESSRR